MKLSIETGTSSLLATVNNLLAEQGIKSYLVGGFIRDALLKRETADIDIALAADALKIAPGIADALGGRFVRLDEANKMGRVVVEKKAPSGGRWQLDFSAFEGSIEQDLGRRDFTIDAMAVDLGELTKDDIQLIDPFNGRADLKDKIIRAVSGTVFSSDAARLLRAVRLAAELGFTIDSQTEALVKRHALLIAGVAGERVREELLRLLAVPDSGWLLPYLDELGLLTAIFPGMAGTKGVGQPKEHFWNVFDHSLKTVAAVDFILHQGSWEYYSEQALAAVPWSEVLARHFARPVSSGSTRRSLLKLAALLHDVAKPQTKALTEDGRTRFLGHDKEGAAIAADILERLRFSGKEVKLVEIVIKYHMRPGQMSQEGLPTRRAIYRYFRDCGEAGIDTLFLSLADHLATRGPNLNLAGWQEHACLVEYVLNQHAEQEKLVAPAKLVSGHDLINVFNMKPGPRMGQLLEAVREAQASGEVSIREEALAYVRKRLETEAVNNYG
ncbi:MAG: CCA tRNA nucleotidyltransferase [Deltaproteobacteria bacterium]|nr:CCA tRNA nucleotidyltransferase [Deltaproteobacteria bacterium]